MFYVKRVTYHLYHHINNLVSHVFPIINSDLDKHFKNNDYHHDGQKSEHSKNFPSHSLKPTESTKDIYYSSIPNYPRLINCVIDKARSNEWESIRVSVYQQHRIIPAAAGSCE
ncbi:hypothetical protein CEXT_10401 [Caerostris extrusa]|uniref:Uncharacterized protein n=1 Tax=Caerostris extrusa TaxID=172846 RepID=A0AAV4M7E9_CAEEX|nr:hypothetical protein CEXT_10401 [Caerostris extrusa]